MTRKYKSITTWDGNLSSIITSDSSGDLTIHLDGYHMTTLQECYAEFAAKLSFPDYFGENLNALSDILTDLSWITFNNLTLVIDRAYLLLTRGTDGDKEALLDLLEYVADFWATPISLGEPWDRGSVVFKTILN